MSALTIRLPNPVHRKLKELAEKMASVLTLDYLKAEAAESDRATFERFLGRVPGAPAAQDDEAVAGELLNPVQGRAQEWN